MASTHIIKNNDGVEIRTPNFYLKSGSIFPIQYVNNQFNISSNTLLTGSLQVISGSITGSLFGTSSWATNTFTASFLPINTYDITSSWATNAITASSISRLNQNVIITGSLTIVTGSATELQVTNVGVNIGNILTDIHNVTGSLRVSGSITGSLFGTSSWATNASTASFLPLGTYNITSSWATNAITSSTIRTIASSSDNNHFFTFVARNNVGSSLVESVFTNENIYLNPNAGTIYAKSFANTGIVTNLITSSWAITSSYALTSAGGGNTSKAGSGSAASFGGSPRTASISFTTPFTNNNYAIAITGEDARSWSIQSKVSGSFVINSNSSVALTGPVYWIATAFGS